MRYYLKEGTQQEGPLKKDEILKRWREGNIRAGVTIRREVEKTWVPFPGIPPFSGMHRMACPDCQWGMIFSRTLVGRRARCTSCRQELTVLIRAEDRIVPPASLSEDTTSESPIADETLASSVVAEPKQPWLMRVLAFPLATKVLAIGCVFVVAVVFVCLTSERWSHSPDSHALGQARRALQPDWNLEPGDAIFMVARALSCAYYLEHTGKTVPTALTSIKLPYFIKQDPLDGLVAVASRVIGLLESPSPDVRRCAISTSAAILGVPPTVPKPDIKGQMRQLSSDLRELGLFPEYPQFGNPDGLTSGDTEVLARFMNNQIAGALSAALQMAAADEVIDARWDAYTQAVDAVLLCLPDAHGIAKPAELAWWGKTKEDRFSPSIRISEGEPIRNAIIVLKHYPQPNRGWKMRGYWMPIRKAIFAVERIEPNSWVQLDSPALWETAWMECSVYAADGRVWTAECGMSPKSPEKSLHSACRSCVIVAKSTSPERRFRDQKTILDLLSFYIDKLENMGQSVDEYDATVERLHRTMGSLLGLFEIQMDTCAEGRRWEGTWYPRAAGGQLQSQIPMGMEFYREDDCAAPNDPFTIPTAPYGHVRVYRPDDPAVVSLAKVFVELRDTGLPLLRLRFTPSEQDSDQDSYLARARRENGGYLPARVDEFFIRYIDEETSIRQVRIRQDGREGIVLHTAN